jgi:LmbE family N-acetylglucosaminyl deacetylase
MMGHPEPNHWVDITGTIDQKIAALMSHTSQHRDPDDMRRWSQQNARDAGLPQNHHAEAFTVIRLD